MTTRCPECQIENTKDSVFCKKCAAPLRSVDEVSLTKTDTRPEDELAIGSAIAAKYKIIAEIGRGGMGIVYKAKDTRLKRAVALKFLKAELTRDKEAKKRFIQEAQAAAALEHPNICTVYEVDETEDQTFIAMSYVEGQSLKDKLKNGHLDIDEAKDIALQVAEGLKEAHEKGIVHRDIKPANIMLTKKGQAKITDFGLAKLSWGIDLTKTFTIVGTVAYMSPEQAKGEDVDHRTDIWSLGVMLYEILAGEKPFIKDHERALIFSILNDEPKSVSSLRPEVPRYLERAIQKALAKDVTQRFRSVDELIEAVKHPIDIEIPKYDKSIAVLPFANMSADPEQEYFCEGMAEEIINALTHIQDLRVVARTSAFSFKGKNEDIREIGKKLSVENVLEGSVRKAGNRLRITAQLVNVEDGYHLWSERYDRTMKDVFDIQDEISFAIVENLKAKLLKREKAALRKQPTEDMEAYNLYLKGRYFVSKITDESLMTAIEYFKESIKRDPSFSLAYSGIAESYVHISKWGEGVLPLKKSRSEAKEVALKAVELNPDIAETHTALGMVATWFDWDRVVAGESFKKAIELSPNSVDTLIWYAQYLNLLEYRFEEAIDLYNRAIELNPLQFIIFNFRGYAYMCNRQFDKCLENAQDLLSLDPNYWYSYHLLGEAYLGKRLYKEAIASYEEAIRRGGRTITNIAELGFAHALAGNTDQALKLLKETEKVAQSTNSFYGYLGVIHVGLGNIEEAFEWFYKSCDERDPMLLVIPPVQWENFQDLRNDPRFKALLKKMGLIHLARKSESSKFIAGRENR